jgi:hypothetical protein
MAIVAAAAEGITGMRWCPSSRIVWKFENDDGSAFIGFAVTDCALLECAYSQMNSSTLIQHPDKPWQFDLGQMTQSNTVTGSRRRIQRVIERVGICIVSIGIEKHKGESADYYVAHVNHVRQRGLGGLGFGGTSTCVHCPLASSITSHLTLAPQSPDNDDFCAVYR